MVIDCHSICTSIAHAYRRSGRDIGEGEAVLFATASLQVSYRKPTPISGPFRVVGRVAEADGRRTRIESTVFDQAGVRTADGKVVAVQVPSSWGGPGGLFASGQLHLADPVLSGTGPW
jgi:acyl-CoA thioesterase FadM